MSLRNNYVAGEQLPAVDMNSIVDAIFTLDHNVLELFLQAYFDGKGVPYTGLFFDGFSDSLKTGSLVDAEITNNKVKIIDNVITPITLEYLVIAGGGGAGGIPDQPGGGGGAGGYRTATGYSLGSTSVPITVGAGGAAHIQGSDSVFDTITSVGGGRGGSKTGVNAGEAGGSGGSGGGGSQNGGGGSGTGGQGNSGGAGGNPSGGGSGGGGGGAGGSGANGSGNNGGNGGNGLSSSITGTPITRAGGGGGKGETGLGGTNGTGGSGGGGTNGGAGTANTGSGGGGNNGVGGSGVVILRFLTSAVQSSMGGTITTDGLFTIHTFNSSGTFTWTPLAGSSTLTGTWISIKTTFQQAKKSLKLWVVRNFSARFNLGASIASGATTLTIAGDQTSKFANTNTIDIYDANNFVRERKTLNAVPSFAAGFTTLTFTPAIVNASGFGTSAFVERVDVKPQVSLVDLGAGDSFADLTYNKSEMQSFFAKVLTRFGTAQVDTAFFKFGTGSVLMTGVGTDLITTPDNVDFNLADKDFTMDFWIRFSSLAGNQGFLSQFGSAGNKSFLFDWSPGNVLSFAYSTDGTNNIPKTVTWAPTTGVFYHLAVVRDGANLRFFVDGVQQGATQNVGTDVIFNSTFTFNIGGVVGVKESFNGWMDELRISNVARYSAGFTPPVAAYTRDGFTTLLVHFDGADASTVFTDDVVGFVEVEDEYEYSQGTAQEDFKAKLILTRVDPDLTVYAKRLGVVLNNT